MQRRSLLAIASPTSRNALTSSKGHKREQPTHSRSISCRLNTEPVARRHPLTFDHKQAPAPMSDRSGKGREATRAEHKREGNAVAGFPLFNDFFDNCHCSSAPRGRIRLNGVSPTESFRRKPFRILELESVSIRQQFIRSVNGTKNMTSRPTQDGAPFQNRGGTVFYWYFILSPVAAVRECSAAFLLCGR